MSKRSYEKRIKAKREAAKAARKRAERIRKLRTWGSAVAAVAVALILFLVFRGDGTKPTANPTTTPAACTGPTPAGPPKGTQYAKAPDNVIDENKIYVATFKTSCGDFTWEMDPKVAPKTVNNFVFLARDNFYDGIYFHRILDAPGKEAIVQAGDPKAAPGNPASGQGGPGYEYDGETPPPTPTGYPRGTVAMANSQGPSTNGSQFFVVVRDWPELQRNFTIFGKVSDPASFATLEKIVALKSPTSEEPIGPIYIIDVTIEERARS